MRFKPFLLFIALLAAVPAFSQKKVDLEWNSNWRNDMPYEVSFHADRLGFVEGNVSVAADGRPVRTVELIDDADARTTLRFSVPKKTGRLELVAGRPASRAASGTVDNLMADVVWTVDKDALTVDLTGGKVTIRSTAWKTACARGKFKIPSDCAGKPVSFELDVDNICAQAASFEICLLQYDKDGSVLPEEISDGRWTSHLHPAHKLTRYREAGFIHPKAAYAELCFKVLASDPVRYDNYGLEVKDEESVRPCIEISHMALRPAARIPFPSYDDSFFGEGRSGKTDDCALKLNRKRAFFYATRSMASWSKGLSLREESLIFYPSAAGTVEAWFKPDWGNSDERVVLFDADHHNSIPCRKGGAPYPAAMGDMFIVKYIPSTHTVSMALKDNKEHKYSQDAQCLIPDGEWSHVAAVWTPGGTARLYVSGREVLSFAVPELEALDLEGEPSPNDANAIQFCVGTNGRLGRNLGKGGIVGTYSGEVDMLRISTGVRYSKKFKPSAKYGCDGDTRAYFAFDRTLDGMSGGGIGRISATINAEKDIHLHNVAGCQYYPEEIIPENDPDKVLVYNHNPVLPSEEDFAASSEVHKFESKVVAGDEFKVNVASSSPYMDYVEYENISDSPVCYPIAVARGEVDPRSYGDIAESFEGLTDRQKINGIFNFMLKASNYFMNYTASFDYGTDSPACVQYNGISTLNSYCGFECGPLNDMTKDLFAYSGGCPSNWTGGYGHSFEEVFYDGMNHTYDLSSRTFFPSMDNETAAGLREIDTQLACVTDWPDAFARMGVRSYRSHCTFFPEKFGVCLNPGEKFRVWWTNNGESNNLQSDKCVLSRDSRKQNYNEICGADPEDKIGVWRVDRLFPDYGNAFIAFDGKPCPDNPAFVNIEDYSFCYSVKGCYPIVAADYKAVLADGSCAVLEISTDNGKTFRPLTCPATYAVRARRGYLVRINAPIDSVVDFKAETEVMVNRRILTGVLHQGENLLKFKAEGDGEVKLTVQWREPAAPIVFEGAADFGSAPGLEQHFTAIDPEKGAVSLKVNGVGPGAVTKVKGAVDASIEGGVLKLSSDCMEPHFAWVTVKDGSREQTLTVFVCRGVRFVKGYGDLKNGSDSYEYSFDAVPAGKYTILALQRHNAASDNRVGLPRTHTLSMNAGGRDYLSGAANNMHFDYDNAQYGVPGGRSRWKWDGPTDYYYPQYYGELSALEMESFERVGYSLVNGVKDEVEVAAVLVVPNPSYETKYDIMRYLFTVNGRPGSVE